MFWEYLYNLYMQGTFKEKTKMTSILFLNICKQS